MITNLNVPEEHILNKIYVIRGQKIMLDMDLSELYHVETKQLKRQVRRNIARFPSDFMFELTLDEAENLRSHFGTSSWGGTRYQPNSFAKASAKAHGIHRARSSNDLECFKQCRHLL
ncbi:MAG: hypothetical protein ACI837_003196 [Crocinitomicaceae bacterium]|jgi:hypothetical protein